MEKYGFKLGLSEVKSITGRAEKLKVNIEST